MKTINLRGMFLIIAVCIALLFSVCSPREDKIEKEWEKMHQSKSQSVKKFNDAKFGMFIHFGAYSRLGGFWKGEKVEGIGECIMRYAEIPQSEYREAIKLFNPVKFNADDWVQAAKMAGMRYIVAMPKHADGFAMYNSKITETYHKKYLYAYCRYTGNLILRTKKSTEQ